MAGGLRPAVEAHFVRPQWGEAVSVVKSLAGIGLALACLAPSPARTQARPPVPKSVLFRLTFEIGEGPARDSGTAWLLRLGRSRVAVTAYHVFAGRAAARDPTFRSRSIDSVARRVTLTSVDPPELSLVLGPNIPIDQAAMNSPRDVAAFRVPRLPTAAALRLASRPPVVGDTLWVFARLRGDSASRGLLHPASLVWVDSTGMLYYVLHEALMPSEDVRRREAARLSADSALSAFVRANGYRAARFFHMIYTSGAPVLDARGTVVGMHVAAAVVADARADSAMARCCSGWPDDQYLGIGVPGDSIGSLIQRALLRHP